MILYHAFHAICTAATRTYYRFTIGGAVVPGAGPVLLVANHQNSLVDAGMVVVSAGRSVRFLAKSPLFTDPRIGWLIRAVGCIPVYRQEDDPARLGENLDSFRAVHEALSEGYAVGIFPEGRSHRDPRMSRLKTGAARIALGAVPAVGGAFPIVPVGLVFDQQAVFRSAARIVVGEPFDWSDLAARGLHDKHAVRDLTTRIDDAMRSVTLNLDSWEDEGVVRTAEAVWTAEVGAPRDPALVMQRLRVTSEGLRRLRAGEDEDWRAVSRDLKTHAQELDALGMNPAALVRQPTFWSNLGWVLRRLPMLATLPVAALAVLLFRFPQELTSFVAGKAAEAEGPDAIPTFRILGGAVIFTVWGLLLTALAGWLGGWGWALAVVVGLPLLGIAGLLVTEWQRLSWRSLRRFFVRHIERERIETLRAAQRDLGARMQALLVVALKRDAAAR
ncbi:MAG: 1-acyl-sn-glycerol-3-phosphate acyltransferase [Gemmatimonadaceae bacterium]|nr:1-acyl-sn-glycerol-3-phosphate acyltransferase [Gemmatimonadaceae bacterium]